MLSNRRNWLKQMGLGALGVSADHILLGAGSTEILDLTSRVAAMNKGSFYLVCRYSCNFSPIYFHA